MTQSANPSSRVDASVAWWRDHAGKYGALAMYSKLSESDDLARVLETGRVDVRRAISVTQMRVGSELRVIEIGCGMGRIANALAEHFGNVLGLDVSPDLIQAAKKNNTRNDVRFDVIDGRILAPAATGQWDSVFCIGVLQYVDEPVIASYCREAYRVLKPGGQFVFEGDLRRKPLRTRLIAVPIRRLLYAFGVERWRGFFTGPGCQRKSHSADLYRKCIRDAGLEMVRLVEASPDETWFVAARPS